MVYQSILKKVAIPFTAMTTASLTSVFHTAQAATVSDMLLQNQGVLTHNFKGQNDGFSIVETTKTVYANIEYITAKIIVALDWLNNLPGSLPKLTADLFTSVYHFLSKIALQTPLIIFDNPFIQNTSLTFSLLSISLVTFLLIYESFMKMLKKKHTDFKKILKRYSIAVAVSGFAPFAFNTGFTFLNQLSNAITKIGGGIDGGNVNGFIAGETLGFFDTLIVILFDLTTIALLIPVCLQAGRRWWDLFCLAAITPLALSCWVFERHEHYFKTWWNKVKSLSMVQLVYSVFILMMGIFIFTTQSLQGGIYTLSIKLLIVCGGLYRLSNPPRFVKSMTGDKTDILDSIEEGKASFKATKRILLLKDRKFDPVKKFAGKLVKWKNKS
ncbi:hypothetical protein J7E63_27045 [Bacillus sp. ISL-75]|uniref:hypothetical protein n=1 Tax=Bacillus sp. ISL-75 TaxID=2819137 RepID=UPI001BEA80D2|nr:hypothetical protein [Bacillus sp. ISL-75]MBT2730487.1 hypothetical protein [Bacillus sp. ISL-75]